MLSPSSPGSMTSSTTRSTLAAAIDASISVAEVTDRAVKPLSDRTSTSMREISASSSTSRMQGFPSTGVG